MSFLRTRVLWVTALVLAISASLSGGAYVLLRSYNSARPEIG